MRYIIKDDSRVPANYTTELVGHHYDYAYLSVNGSHGKTGKQIYDEISHWFSFKDLKRVLFNEQGHVCAYCGRRVPEPTLSPISSTEHVLPKGHYVESVGEYRNLIISCQGNRTASASTPVEEEGKKRLHCDAHKEEDEIPISPLTSGCETRFTYDYRGGISPSASSDVDAIKTIRVLNLNEKALSKDRENAIDAYLWDSTTNDFVPNDILELTKDMLNQKDANGMYEPFYFVIIDVIDQLLGNKI